MFEEEKYPLEPVEPVTTKKEEVYLELLSEAEYQICNRKENERIRSDEENRSIYNSQINRYILNYGSIEKKNIEIRASNKYFREMKKASAKIWSSLTEKLQASIAQTLGISRQILY